MNKAEPLAQIQLPQWADELFDHNQRTARKAGSRRYYYDMSLGTSPYSATIWTG